MSHIPFSPSFFCSNNVLLSLRLNHPSSTLPSASLCAPAVKPRKSRATARTVSSTVQAASEAGSSDHQAPGQSNMWCSLSVRQCATTALAVSWPCVCACHRSKAAFSQSCHFALFVKAVARASTDCFFTFCDVHLAGACRRRACSAGRSSLVHAAGALWCVLLPGATNR